jgi:hypothetical protein
VFGELRKKMLFDRIDLEAIGIEKGNFIQFAAPNLFYDGTGTISVSESNVTGSGTDFITDLKPGYRIKTQGGQIRIVKNITGKNNLEIEGAFTSLEDNAAFKYLISADDKYDLFIRVSNTKAVMTLMKYLATAYLDYRVLEAEYLTKNKKDYSDVLKIVQLAEMYLTAKEMIKGDEIFKDNGFDVETSSGVTFTKGKRRSISSLNSTAMRLLRSIGCQVDSILSDQDIYV